MVLAKWSKLAPKVYLANCLARLPIQSTFIHKEEFQ